MNASEGQRRGIDDAGRLNEIVGMRREKVLTLFEAELLEAIRLLTQRVGEVASAIEELR